MAKETQLISVETVITRYHFIYYSLGYDQIAYQEIRKKFDGDRSAKDFVDKHLDPLLKAADVLICRYCLSRVHHELDNGVFAASG